MGSLFDHPTQTELLAPTFEWKFTHRYPNHSLMNFSRFDDFIPDEDLETLWRDYAQGGYLNPEILDTIHTANPNVRFMILIRVEYDRVVHEHTDGGTTSTHRRVGCTMGLFDLETHRSIWEGRTLQEVDRAEDQSTVLEYQGFQSMKAENGKFQISEAEEKRNVPPFYDVYEKCLANLLFQLNKALYGEEKKIEDDSTPMGIGMD